MTVTQTSLGLSQVSTELEHLPPIETGTQRLHFRANAGKQKEQKNTCNSYFTSWASETAVLAPSLNNTSEVASSKALKQWSQVRLRSTL